MKDATKERLKALEKVGRVVIKIGSAVLTSEDGLDLRVVNRLVDQIALIHDRGVDVILVSSGAVAAGCKVLSSCRAKSDLVFKQATSAVGQSRLMHAYDEVFGRYKKITAQILLTRDDLNNRERFINARNTMLQLLRWRVIPIINENDTVAVQELKFGDNDALAALILNLAEADLFINLTSADGVFSDNPLENSQAERIACIRDINAMPIQEMCKGKTKQGSGGMYSKLMAARKAAQIGVPTLILSGKDRFCLEKAFEGEDLGTWIMPCQKVISSRKFWLAYNLEPCGEVVIDQGAARAVFLQGKSLLPAGIVAVKGEFGKGDLVKVIVRGGAEKPAVGLSNYSSSDLALIMGKKSSEIEELLGECLYSEAIHRDNLLSEVLGL
ncbi:glutamate 5-kinase [Desulfonatronovibrio hydrogenovorans]|uniref:glutamate 5-kinase n=1 Tax=Desulfonatronovibrio hydrogenovorans TaxID=53245 RepID=UPI00048C1A90|nr:glutamate 5-kinase [Desulfonatronovibrio hydrogenovorans]